MPVSPCTFCLIERLVGGYNDVLLAARDIHGTRSGYPDANRDPPEGTESMFNMQRKDIANDRLTEAERFLDIRVWQDQCKLFPTIARHNLVVPVEALPEAISQQG